MPFETRVSPLHPTMSSSLTSTWLTQDLTALPEDICSHLIFVCVCVCVHECVLGHVRVTSTHSAGMKLGQNGTVSLKMTQCRVVSSNVSVVIYWLIHSVVVCLIVWLCVSDSVGRLTNVNSLKALLCVCVCVWSLSMFDEVCSGWVSECVHDSSLPRITLTQLTDRWPITWRVCVAVFDQSLPVIVALSLPISQSVTTDQSRDVFVFFVLLFVFDQSLLLCHCQSVTSDYKTWTTATRHHLVSLSVWER